MSMPELRVIKLEPIRIPDGHPNYLDWRDRGILKNVRNQGRCQCCWAIIAIQVVEAVWYCTYNKELKPLSPQMLLDCVNQNPKKEEQDKRGCYTLSALKAFEWLTNSEVYAEADYTYQAKRGRCRRIKKPSARVKIDKVETIKGSQRETIFVRVTSHPVAAVVDAYPEFVDLRGEIYEGPKKKPVKKVLQHAVAIIGYGTEGNGPTAKNYWLIMSSWGKDWGVNGVGRVSRDHMVNDDYLVRRISYPVFEAKHEE
ncbi:hypothetical protein PTKIN_Ptkin19aG0071400 [Pterospermum kingtungense]